MAKTKASSKLKALPKSPSIAQTLPSDAVLDALKMILLGAPLNEVLTTITCLIEAHSTGMLCSIFLLDEDSCHLRWKPLTKQDKLMNPVAGNVKVGKVIMRAARI